MSSSSLSSLTAPSTSQSRSVAPPGSEPDRFVSASPLVMAAICSDGICLLATHSSPAYEPLQIGVVEVTEQDAKTATSTRQRDSGVNAHDDEGRPSDGASNTVVNSKEDRTSQYQDLPSLYRGPTRIAWIDDTRGGVCCVTSGWRTDCAMLISKCRSLVMSERSRYGMVDRSTGYFVASAASMWLAHGVFSDSVSVLVRDRRDSFHC